MCRRDDPDLAQDRIDSKDNHHYKHASEDESEDAIVFGKLARNGPLETVKEDEFEKPPEDLEVPEAAKLANGETPEVAYRGNGDSDDEMQPKESWREKNHTNVACNQEYSQMP